ncbi:hypothetical protein M422DRAFT_179901, partial [Sphaerobolus stellatus SS14]
IDKMKLHTLVHIPEDIRNHRPLVRSETEVFESFNGVFRLCSIHSNHQAPSKDIAIKCAQMDMTKHLMWRSLGFKK